MRFEVRSYSHCVGEFNYHIQITSAYRRKVMEDEQVNKLVRAYIIAKLDELKVQVVTMKGGPEHLHIFVKNCKNVAPANLIGQLKGFSSRMLRKNHWNLFKHLLWGHKFWSEGYFCRSIGSTTTEAVEYYIEHAQDKHWVDYEEYQQQLNV
jgi:putative transposase